MRSDELKAQATANLALKTIQMMEALSAIHRLRFEIVLYSDRDGKPKWVASLGKFARFEAESFPDAVNQLIKYFQENTALL